MLDSMYASPLSITPCLVHNTHHPHQLDSYCSVSSSSGTVTPDSVSSLMLDSESDSEEELAGLSLAPPVGMPRSEPPAKPVYRKNSIRTFIPLGRCKSNLAEYFPPKATSSRHRRCLFAQSRKYHRCASPI